MRTLLAALLFAPLAAAAQQAQVNYYDVQGSDFNTLLRALNARGQHHGRADWNLSYKYRWRESGGSCAVESVSTELSLVMTLPRWSPSPGASRDLAARWERYIAALRVHEEGHLEHGRSFQAALRAQLAAMSAPTCAALEAAVSARFAQMHADYQARDRAYDARTEHGKSQGAWFQ